MGKYHRFHGIRINPHTPFHPSAAGMDKTAEALFIHINISDQHTDLAAYNSHGIP